MTPVFDDELVNPSKKARTRSNEVVKKLSFQLGCQTHDDDTNATKAILQKLNENVEKKSNDKVNVTDSNMKAIETSKDRKSTRLNSSHSIASRMPSSA